MFTLQKQDSSGQTRYLAHSGRFVVDSRFAWHLTYSDAIRCQRRHSDCLIVLVLRERQRLGQRQEQRQGFAETVLTGGLVCMACAVLYTFMNFGDSFQLFQF